MNKCQKCYNSIPAYLKQNGKTHNLCSRKFCLECSPFGKRNNKDLSKTDILYVEKNGVKYKKCPCCQEVLEISEKYFNFRKNNRTCTYCKRCNNNKTKERQHILKEKAVAYKGGCCEFCSYKKCIAALEFHHKEPNNKDFQISKSISYDFELIKKELDKCILLCANCHREEHVKMNI